MGTLTVFFVGICSHLRESTSREVEHRVVLVNARDGKVINRKTIVPHTATLRYRDNGKSARAVSLNGARITVKNPAATGILYADSFVTCIPRLTKYAPELQALSLDVVKGHDPSLVAAYFDVTAGRFIGGADKVGAAVGILNVDTDGDPILVIENFQGKGVHEITLPTDAEVQVENVGPGREEGDSPQDFLLNYLVALRVPPDAEGPTTRGNCNVNVTLPFAGNTVDPGCSNSNYP